MRIPNLPRTLVGTGTAVDTGVVAVGRAVAVSLVMSSNNQDSSVDLNTFRQLDAQIKFKKKNKNKNKPPS